MSDFKYEAVILTAGRSSRMGYPKALLRTGEGKTFLSRIDRCCRAVVPPPKKINVVLGFNKDEIVRESDLTECKVVFNLDPSRGMLSSILSALRAVSDEAIGILLCLVDHPLVRQETYQKIVDCARKNPGRIVIPQYKGRGGHPVFFPRETFADLWECPLDQGARWVVNKNRDITTRPNVDDPGIRKDIDNPELYRENVPGGRIPKT